MIFVPLGAFAAPTNAAIPAGLGGAVQGRPDMPPDVMIERIPAGYDPARRAANVPAFWVRPGYHVELAAKLPEARFMVADASGTLYVSQPTAGTIEMLRRSGKTYEKAGDFVTGYPSAHGMQVKDGWLWFTTSDGIHRAQISSPPKPASQVETILTGLPYGGHWWRSILATDDGFFTSIGDSGNINDLRSSDREKIWKYSLDGKTRELWSSGIRNTEKLLFKPGTNELYGCDQGSDNFGKNLGEVQGRNQPVTDFNPPDEFNKYVKGDFYGHPFVVGNRIPRYEFMNNPDILQLAASTVPPIWNFGPHWAADGWIFVQDSALGKDFYGDALVALHGSWNRTVKAGYRIERLMFDKIIKEPFGSQLLVSTLGEQNETFARPVDVLIEPGTGDILFSDDMGNRIFRIIPDK
jgi:glucose/arabinose dehydrogenase